MTENEEPRLRNLTVGQVLRQKAKPFALGLTIGAVGIVGVALATGPDAHAATPNSVQRCMEALNSAGLAGPELCEPLVKPITLPACPTEDSDNCVWDAAARGNRAGQSFIRLAGRTYTLAN